MNDGIKVFTTTAKDEMAYLKLVMALMSDNVDAYDLLPDTNALRNLWTMICYLYKREFTMSQKLYGAKTGNEQKQIAAEKTINFIIKIGERA